MAQSEIFWFCLLLFFFFFFQAEDGIRDDLVTGVQTCALPISSPQLCRQSPDHPAGMPLEWSVPPPPTIPTARARRPGWGQGVGIGGAAPAPRWLRQRGRSARATPG